MSNAHKVLSLREFMKRRAQFSQLLSSSSSLTINRYFRLMALSMAEIVINLPLSTYGLYFNILSQPIYPWQGWANLHFDYFIVDTFPSVLWRSNIHAVVNLELSRWSLVLGAFIFFGFFGFAEEARKKYYSAFRAVAKIFGVHPASSTQNGSKTFTRCVFLYHIFFIAEFK